MTTPAWLQGAEFSDLDRHFAAFIARFGGHVEMVPVAAAALSRSVRENHVCLTLASIAKSFPDLASPAEWKQELLAAPAVGPPDAGTPLVLDGADRLYLRRYWDYQKRLALTILEKCGRNPDAAAPNGATQEDAIAAALRNELTIISGGPGTGKTSTVLRILGRLLAAEGGEHLRVALCAPTGKAASRLEEAVRAGTDPRMPRTAQTIHRLLGPKARSVYFRHDAENPLPLDVLIVDEASMIALPLMAKLFDALPPRCRVLLLGDRDQLASVEPGAVLADMVDAAAAPASPLRGSIVTLQQNYRFAADSSVAQACSAVRAGDAAGVITLLRSDTREDLVSTEIVNLAELKEKFVTRAIAGYADFARERDPAAALARLQSFRVLTPLRQGSWGVAGLNRAIVRALPAGAENAGRPILILQNDYELDLYNGDLGVLLADPLDGQSYAWFSARDNNVRRVAPARLPEHETAYAMTVHKAQGSEFERVLFVLPETDSPLLTRELIYTALTRARSSVDFCWNEPVLRAVIARQAIRETGLRDLLSKPA